MAGVSPASAADEHYVADIYEDARSLAHDEDGVALVHGVGEQHQATDEAQVPERRRNDAFAAAFVHGLSLGWPPREIAVVANKVGAIVATRPGGTPGWTVGEALQLGAER